jgi:hypothetical protein
VNADDGVDIGDGFATDVTSRCTSIVGLFVTTVDCTECFEETLEVGRETVVCLDLGVEECVSATSDTIYSWKIEDVKECGRRRVKFVGNVGMPCY